MKKNTFINKTKQLIIFSMISVASLSSQELDNSFIDSLPDDIKADVLNRSKQQDDKSENKFNSFQNSSKLESAEDLYELKNRIEQDLESLNKRLNNDKELILNDDLKLFGSNFFSTFQTSFMPINEPNPESDYILDVGDSISLQIIGQRNFIEKLSVNRDGSINIPDIGKLIIAGLDIDEASKLIKAKVKATFIGTEAFISLDSIRDVNILVTGNAKNPGIYTLNGNSNILHAISAAGGINEYGSYREINLIRDDEVIETLDLYALLVDGSYNLKKRLRAGDLIFVESVKNIVSIDGAVKRPAKYEVGDNQSLGDVISYANGIKNTADIQTITLERILNGSLKSIPIVNKTQFSSIKPVDGDLIYIREYPYRNVKIHGAVKKPGSYTMAAGQTLSDLIIQAGGLISGAYPFGGVYTTVDAKKINEKSKDRLYEDFLDNIIALSQLNISQNFDLTPLVKLTEQIRNTESNGRVVVDLLNDESISLYTLSDGDELYIPEINNNVYVYGEIASEGAVMYEQNKSIEYFIEKSGGYNKFADIDSIYILHPNGESEKYSKKRNLFESKPASIAQIYPGSIIFIPRKLDETTSRRLATQAYVSILGNLGIALASLSTINKN